MNLSSWNVMPDLAQIIFPGVFDERQGKRKMEFF